ncbi:Hypothetical_protein [Hexamita inflata]|uniref:Hypothetical_protein n=1 Tax=Hexamita inflata TaxID=28002 RepID=A0AA86U9B0_9EUKA|nr:Hypothetical protein HINF_LOCUS31456 [Hexamita inflata]
MQSTFTIERLIALLDFRTDCDIFTFKEAVTAVNDLMFINLNAQEIYNYMKDPRNTKQYSATPFTRDQLKDFWLANIKFKGVYDFFERLSSIPASSAAVERVNSMIHRATGHFTRKGLKLFTMECIIMVYTGRILCDRKMAEYEKQQEQWMVSCDEYEDLEDLNLHQEIPDHQPVL